MFLLVIILPTHRGMEDWVNPCQVELVLNLGPVTWQSAALPTELSQLGILIILVLGMKEPKTIAELNFNTPEASMITEIKITKRPGPYYRCGRPHFQNNCKSHERNNSNKFQNTSSIWQNYKESTYTQNFHDNRNNSNMVPHRNLIIPSVPANKVRWQLVSMLNTIKCFLRKKEKI